jgi:hypothetical protein
MSATDLGMVGADHFSTADLDGPSEDERFRHLFPCSLKDSAERWAGDVHLCCPFFLRVAKMIGQPERLELIGCEKNDVEIAERDPCGLECQSTRTACDIALFDGPGHGL